MSSHSGAVKTGSYRNIRMTNHVQIVSGVDDFAADAYPKERQRCPNHPATVLNVYNTSGVCGACRSEELNRRMG